MALFWTIGIIGLLICQALMFILILAFARELGVILVRLGPISARPAPEGPAVGEVVEPIEMVDITGKAHPLRPRKSNALLVFISPSCPACEELLPGMRTLAKEYRTTGLKVYALSARDPSPEDYAYAAGLTRSVPYICSAALHEAYSIHGTP